MSPAAVEMVISALHIMTGAGGTGKRGQAKIKQVRAAAALCAYSCFLGRLNENGVHTLTCRSCNTVTTKG